MSMPATIRSLSAWKAGALVFSLALVLFGSAFSGAQAEPPQGTAAASESKPEKAVESASEQPAKEGKAAEEDESAAFKHSSSVQFLARLTGLSVDHAYWLAVLLNFAVLAGLLGWAMSKNLPGAFRNRTASIQKAMEEARRASAEANQRLAEVEARLSRLDAEISSMRETAEKDSAAEMARIAAAADEDGRKIVQSAEQEIEAAAKQARRELTAFAADLAVSLAQKQIHVDATADQALVGSFADHLGSGGGQKGGN